ncbi:HAMP domain-containing sensor histidine kinase [Clostridium sp. BNL1100]|uniref:sensor histidine kinase n=1 Tax=Clostridium sp. BNL1100 TaxID=755731 RepID=UPI00024A7EF0|nr:HAMP domain-containing sensor histidine kinase [Clostridium sp. BNL1100]AEY65017.1 histidine kinase [Clostridium sp. BNL1100]
MHIIATIIVWGLSTLILVAGSKYRPLRWICLLGYILGGGVLGRFLNNISSSSLVVTSIYKLLSSLFLSVSYCFVPYFLIMFSRSYSGQFLVRHPVGKIICEMALLIPPTITILSFGLINPSYEYHIFLIFWVTPYFIIANYILIKSFFNEKVPAIKRQKLSTCVTVFVGSVYGYISCHLFPVLRVKLGHAERNPFVIFALLIAFVILSSRYGILGVKLNFEKYDPFNSIMMLSSGTLILSHTLKNELSKISMCAQNIKTIPKNDINRIEKNADIILDSSQYVLDMVKKIKDHVAEIRLEKNMGNIASLIEDSLGMVKPFTDVKNIRIIKNYSRDTSISMDRKNVKEVLVNIFMNSVEASKLGDSLSICVYIDGRYYTIAVTDTGEGIENENLHKVVQPFFTTKKGESNFGLGLSFCYNVMQKHNGLMEIQSKPGAGTTIYLKFPYH